MDELVTWNFRAQLGIVFFFLTVSSSQLRSFQGKKENPSWVDISMSPEGRSGRLGGHFDRPDPDDPW